MDKKIKILMVSSEAAPIVKVGGLGDVVGSLPSALARLGCETRIIIPFSRGVDRKKYRLKKIKSNLKVNFSGKDFAVNIWQTNSAVPGAVVYLVENYHYLKDMKEYIDFLLNVKSVILELVIGAIQKSLLRL